MARLCGMLNALNELASYQSAGFCVMSVCGTNFLADLVHVELQESFSNHAASIFI